jgi:large repetitive protein
MRLNKFINLLVLPFAALCCGVASAQMDITTWQVNTSHTGVNPTESKLTPGFVEGTGNLSCLFAEQLDGQVNAQPLYLTTATLSALPGSFPDKAQHNVVYVATQNGTVYAIDGDLTSDSCSGVHMHYLWSKHLINAPEGPTPNGVPESFNDIGGAPDISPLLGLTETPVIDTSTGTLYVVVAVKDMVDTATIPANAPFVQVLYALDVKTGSVKGVLNLTPEFNGDYTQQACNAAPPAVCDVPTPSVSAGRIPFFAEHQHLRSGLTLDSAHQTLYMAFASHNDQTPYWGLVLGYNISNLNSITLKGEFNTMPVGNSQEGGIWMGGASPALDPQTNQLFVATGNGQWNQLPSGSDSSGPFTTGTDFSMSVLSLSTDPATIVNYRGEPEMRVPFTPADGNFKWFTPSQWNEFNNGDRDLGSGGLLLLPPLSGASGETRNLMIGGGKGGFMYLLDRTNLGGNIPDPNQVGAGIVTTPNPNAVQQIMEPGLAQIFNTPTYFNGNIYYGTGNAAVNQRAVAFDPTTNNFISPTEISSKQNAPNFTGGNFISASSPTTDGVVWQVANGINAWDATNVTSTIFTSSPGLPDGTSGQCQSSTWALPIVNNGKIYFSCFQQPPDKSTNEPGYLFVYGPTPAVAGAPVETAANLTATANSANQITLSWSVTTNTNPPDITTYKILRSTGNANNFGTISTNVPFGTTSFVDVNLTPNTTYFYEVVATNQDGPGVTSPSASATTLSQFEEQGLVAYWPFDEITSNPTSSTSADVTGHGHTAQKGASTVEDHPDIGLINGSWTFHGTHTLDNLIIADAPDLDFTSTQSFSLTAWVNASTPQGSGEDPLPSESSIIAKSADQGALYGLYINSDGNWAARGPSGDLEGTPAVKDAWTHLALVQDGVKGVRSFYINGVKQPNTAPAQNANGQGQLWFGDQNATLNGVAAVDGFAGNLDEVRIYNRALSQSDINDLMADPILQVNSLQPSGPQTLPVTLFPSPVPLTEPRMPANQTYTLQVTFATPVAATPQVVLQGQPGVTSVTGQVANASLDSTNKILTVRLTGVANAQALDLHISNINTPSGITNAIQDIPFNVFIGDVSQDHKVDQFDTGAIMGATLGSGSTIPGQFTNTVTAANAIFDLNGDGVIDSNDVKVITNAPSTSWTAPGDTNLAFFKPAIASSNNNGNVQQNAFDNNVNDNWESMQAGPGASNTGVPGTDPSFIYVNLNAPATVDGFAIMWGGSAALDYTIDACTVAPNAGNCSSGWQNMVTATNGVNNELQSYNDLQPVTAQYFRMNGTVRVNAPFGYQIDEFYVFGSYNAGNPQQTSVVINSPLSETAIAGVPFPTYTITSTPTATTFGATNLPGNLSLNSATGQITGTPTSASATPINVGLSATTSAGQTGTATLILTINAPTPIITSAASEPAMVGTPFNYTITANPAAASFGAASLPPGLSLVGAVISGTPTASGTFPITLSAINSTGQTGTATLVLTISPAVVVTPPAPPTGVTTTAVSASQINLSWTASTTSGVTYSVFRSTTSGFAPSTANQVTGASNLTATTFSDSGLTAATTYFYIVEAINTAGPTQSAQVSATTLAASGTTPLTEVLAIDAGNLTNTPPVIAPFVLDTDFTGSTGTDTAGQTINTTGVLGAAAQSVYQTAHQGAVTYTIPSSLLTPGQPYTVVLHFAELFFTQPNQRQFNVSINGVQVLQNFDIVAEAGNANFTAVVETFPNITPVNGQIVIAFTGGAEDQPMVNGIEIQTGGTPIPSAPTGLMATTVSTNQINLNWTASISSGVTYNVYRSNTPGFIPTAATTPIASNVQGTTFSDTGLTPQTMYYYVVEAVTGSGVSSPQSQHAPALTLATSTDAIAIDAGSSMVVAEFFADKDFAGGGIDTTTNPINTAGVVGAAPQAVYQTARQGNVTYVIPASALTTQKPNYTVVLHFAELFFPNAGQRVFNISINGTQVQSNFDIVGAASNNSNLTAVVLTFPNIPIVNGQIAISFTGVKDQPMVNGIEIQ